MPPVAECLGEGRPTPRRAAAAVLTLVSLSCPLAGAAAAITTLFDTGVNSAHAVLPNDSA